MPGLVLSESRNLTNGPVWHALYRLAMPMVFGIVAILSTSLVDTYFVGKLGTQPLAALSFTFPVALTISSLAIGLGAGAASVVSRAVGGRSDREAKRLSTDSLALSVIVVAIVSVVGYFTIRPLFSLLGAEGETLDLIERYMRIWYISMPFLVIPMVANALIRAVGDAFWPSIIMVGAAVVNIGTTPLLIFGYWGLPELGIEGAAWGTAIARVTTLFFSLFILIFREHLITFVVPPMQELLHSWKEVLTIGLPAAGGNMVNPLGIGVVTAFLAAFGESTVAAFGVATRVESFSVIPMLALSAAIGPIAGQNWGAGKIQRITGALKVCFAVCTAWSALLAMVFWVFGESVAGWFASEQAVRQEAGDYLAIVPFSLWGYGFVIIAAAAYNALGKAITGLGYYLVRTAFLYIPLAWIAAHYFASKEVYIAIACANAVAGLASALYAIWWLQRRDRASN